MKYLLSAYTLSLFVVLTPSARAVDLDSVSRPTVSCYEDAVDFGTWCARALEERWGVVSDGREYLPVSDTEHGLLEGLKNESVLLSRKFLDTFIEERDGGSFDNYFSTQLIFTNGLGHVVTNFISEFPFHTATGLISALSFPSNYFSVTPVKGLSTECDSLSDFDGRQVGRNSRDYGWENLQAVINALKKTQGQLSWKIEKETEVRNYSQGYYWDEYYGSGGYPPYISNTNGEDFAAFECVTNVSVQTIIDTGSGFASKIVPHVVIHYSSLVYNWHDGNTVEGDTYNRYMNSTDKGQSGLVGISDFKSWVRKENIYTNSSVKSVGDLYGRLSYPAVNTNSYTNCIPNYQSVSVNAPNCSGTEAGYGDDLCGSFSSTPVTPSDLTLPHKRYVTASPMVTWVTVPDLHVLNKTLRDGMNLSDSDSPSKTCIVHDDGSASTFDSEFISNDERWKHYRAESMRFGQLKLALKHNFSYK